MAVKKVNFWGEGFRPERWLLQGDILSTTLFNFIIDAVVWKLQENITVYENEGLKTLVCFYADDGYVGGTKRNRVQIITD